MIISQGAEAKIYKEDKLIIKDRFVKTYRHKELDLNLRKSRTRHEAKILEKLRQLNFPAPRVSSTEESKLTMDFIEGKLVKEIFDKDFKKLAPEIGKKIAILHSNNIIHSDLTTSNMIFNKEVFFIDFGLSFISTRVEDKAVDLHLLDRAIESKHYKVYPKAFNLIVESYKKNLSYADDIIKRFEEVKKRGRYKQH